MAIRPRVRFVPPVDPVAQAQRNAQGLRFLGGLVHSAGVATDRRARGVCIGCGKVPAGAPVYTCVGCVGDLGHGLVDSAIDLVFGGRGGSGGK